MSPFVCACARAEAHLGPRGVPPKCERGARCERVRACARLTSCLLTLRSRWHRPRRQMPGKTVSQFRSGSLTQAIKERGERLVCAHKTHTRQLFVHVTNMD